MGRISSAVLRYLAPRMYCNSLAEVSADYLRRIGIRGVILDLDNTLVPWSESRTRAPEREWVADCRRQGLRLCILSNTHRMARLRALASELGIPHIRGGKPSRRGFRTAMTLLGTSPDETAVIGDQLFTDVLGGNRAGLYTVLVRRMSDREFIGTYLSRAAERLVFFLLNRWGHGPGGAWRATEDAR